MLRSVFSTAVKVYGSLTNYLQEDQSVVANVDEVQNLESLQQPSTSTQAVVRPRPRAIPRRVVVRRPMKIYEEDETIDMACQEGRCRHRWHENPDCDDVFADHDSHNGDRTAERALRPGEVRASERIALAEAERQDRVADFVQRVLNNDSSESDQDLPPPVVACNRPGCNCIAHSTNSLYASEQPSDRSFEATPTMLSQASKSADTSESG